MTMDASRDAADPVRDQWYDAAAVAARFHVSRSTVRSWVRRGLLAPGHTLGGASVWPSAEIEAFTPPNPNGGRPAARTQMAPGAAE